MELTPETKILCWACQQEQTIAQKRENDGVCIYCENEIDEEDIHEDDILG